MLLKNERYLKGSPPHGRGIADAWKRYPHAMRITPAWAGNSKAIPKTLTTGKDHPRMGGE